MRNYNTSDHYTAKTINTKYPHFYEKLKEYFEYTNKASVIFLGVYGLYSDQIKTEIFYQANEFKSVKNDKLNQIRGGTDTEWNNLLNALLIKISLKDNVSIEDLLGDKDLYNKYLDMLLRGSENVLEYLMDNELNSYKTAISPSNKENFIMNILLLIDSVNESEIF